MLTYGEIGLIVLVVTVLVSAVWRSDRVQRWQIKNEIKKQRARNKEQEEADNKRHSTPLHAISAHVHTIGNALHAQGEEQDRQDRERASRENRVLIVIALTAILAFVSDWIFYNQLNEMRNDGRAWVGAINATIVPTFQVGEPASMTLIYSNTGKTPATNLIIASTAEMFSRDEWNKGNASIQIANYEKKCMATLRPGPYRVAFPTTGFSAYSLQVDSFDKENPPVDKAKVAVSQDFIDGKAFMTLVGCFVYVSNGATHHTASCFWFQNKKTKPDSMNICTVGNDAD